MSLKVEGKYFGTEIDQKWWRRYTKNKMLSRGNGIFQINEHGISFLRKLTKTPITIRFSDFQGVIIGSWHAGQWGAGRQIVKILWEKDGQLLCSGFTISTDSKEIISMLEAAKT